MTQAIMVVPAGSGVGLTSIALGLVRMFNENGIKVSFFQPIAQKHVFYERIKMDVADAILKPLSTDETETMLSENMRDELLERIVEDYQAAAKQADVVVILGLVAIDEYPYAHALNASIAQALNAEIVLVASPQKHTPTQLEERISITAKPYQRLMQRPILGTIINKIGVAITDKASLQLETSSDAIHNEITKLRAHFGKSNNIPILAYIPWEPKISAPRVKEIASLINAEVIHSGDMDHRRIYHITLCARQVSHILDALKPGTLIITPADRSDIIIATAMAVLNGTKIACLLLTGDYDVEPQVLTLCHHAMELGLPILKVKMNSFETTVTLQNIDFQIPPDDIERIESNKDHVAHHIPFDAFSAWLKLIPETRFSPPAFRYYLLENARRAKKRIVLPEGEELRTIHAALRCATRKIAHCILLGDPERIKQTAENEGLDLNTGATYIEIISPASLREQYVSGLMKRRSHKGVSEVQARDALNDNIVLGTMMLAEGDVDGLVAGALHTTANTIRPALQLVKTAPDAELVSSVFFMCLPNEVLVYADCAVNPNPNASQLADIAIQSAKTAETFGISPRIAMISYATGDSSTGESVEKIKEATKLIKARRPDLLVDGPLQYDAAVNLDVAKKKAPTSLVAGRANVFIFPDLNTGNTTYKAVQRSSNALCVGPVLQGLNKPVNDLSRGASIDDIVFTIALTAIQA